MTFSQGALSTEWLDRFPLEQVGTIITYVADSWADLCVSFPEAHHAEESEPDLTKSLSEHLDDPIRRRSAGVGGRFSSERPVNKRTTKGRLKQIGRTDIDYIFPAPGDATLTMEFKKLDGSPNLRSKYKGKGLNKFVSGPYAVREKCGIMVALTACPINIEAGKLAASIEKTKAILKCRLNGGGKAVTAPASAYGSTVSFETDHDRPGISADPILIGHVFLPLPNKP